MTTRPLLLGIAIVWGMLASSVSHATCSAPSNGVFPVPITNDADTITTGRAVAAASSGFTASEGSIAYDTTADTLKSCDGTNWNAIGSGASAVGSLGYLQFNGGGTTLSATSAFYASSTTGRLGIGTVSPQTPLEVAGIISSTGLSITGVISASSHMVVGTSSATCGAGTKGAIRYSTTSSTMEYCNSSAWTSMGPSGTTAYALKYGSANNTGVTAGSVVNMAVTENAYGSDITTSGNRITVAPGFSYMLMATLRLNANPGIGDYRIYDVTNGAYVGGNGTGANASNYTDVPAIAFVNPTVATTYEVRITGVAGTVDVVGGYGGFFAAKLGGGNAGTGGGASALDDLSDVVISSAATGQALAHNGTNFVNMSALTGLTAVSVTGAISASSVSLTGNLFSAGISTTTLWVNGVSITGSGGASTLDALSDAAVTSAALGQVLAYNGTNFVNTSTLISLTGVSVTGTVTATTVSTTGNIFTTDLKARNISSTGVIQSNGISVTGTITATTVSLSGNLFSAGISTTTLWVNGVSITGTGVPTGTIAAFESSSCPSGWTEYTAARGRFLRGIDNGAGNDPAGTRAPGATQTDAMQGHYHPFVMDVGTITNGSNSLGTAGNTFALGSGSLYGSVVPSSSGPASDGTNGTPRTANETRPKNVAVTWCQYSGVGTVTATGLADGSAGSPSMMFANDTDTGWWRQAANTMAASTGGTERMRIDSSGNVGIGGTPVSHRLLVEGTNQFLGAFLRPAATNGSLMQIIVGKDTGTNYAQGALTYTYNSGTPANSYVSLGNSTTDSAMLNVLGNGYVGIGTTAPNTPLSIGGPITAYTSARIGVLWDSGNSHQGLVLQNSSASFSGSPIIFVNSAGGLSGYVAQAASSVTYNTSSDRRLKENISPTVRGLSVLTSIPVKDFNFIGDNNKKRVQGFVAQEIMSAYPEAVSTNGDNGRTPLRKGDMSWGVDYGRLTPLLVKSIQELKTLNDALVSRTTVLEAQLKAANDNYARSISKLEAKLETLEAAMHRAAPNR